MSASTPDPVFGLSVAFQPIVHVGRDCVIYAQDTLIQGARGETAAMIRARITGRNLHAFDATCRQLAIETALDLGLASRLCLSIASRAIGDVQYGLQATLRAADTIGFPPSRLVFVISARAVGVLGEAARPVLAACRSEGFQLALADFGTGVQGLNMLFDLQPDLIKLEASLVQEIDHDADQRRFVNMIARGCRQLNLQLIAEGVATARTVGNLIACGVTMMQGDILARPAIGALPAVSADAVRQACRRAGLPLPPTQSDTPSGCGTAAKIIGRPPETFHDRQRRSARQGKVR